MKKRGFILLLSLCICLWGCQAAETNPPEVASATEQPADAPKEEVERDFSGYEAVHALMKKHIVGEGAGGAWHDAYPEGIEVSYRWPLEGSEEGVWDTKNAATPIVENNQLFGGWLAAHVTLEVTALAHLTGEEGDKVMVHISRDMGDTWSNVEFDTPEDIAHPTVDDIYLDGDGWGYMTVIGFAMGESPAHRAVRLFQTGDFGATWESAGSLVFDEAKAYYGAVVTREGRYFVAARGEEEFGLTLYHSPDGDQWQKDSWLVPEKFGAPNINIYPPVFDGAVGVVPVGLYDITPGYYDGYQTGQTTDCMFFTLDGGDTWSFLPYRRVENITSMMDETTFLRLREKLLAGKSPGEGGAVRTTMTAHHTGEDGVVEVILSPDIPEGERGVVSIAIGDFTLLLPRGGYVDEYLPKYTAGQVYVELSRQMQLFPDDSLELILNPLLALL